MEDSTNSSSDLSVLSHSLSPLATDSEVSNPSQSPPPPKKRKIHKRRQSTIDKAYELQNWFRDHDISLYDALKLFRKLHKDDRGRGRNHWTNLLKKLHRENDPLLRALNDERGAGEVTEESRRKGKLSTLRKLKFGASHLRREISQLSDKMDIYGSWDTSKPAEFMSGSSNEVLSQIRRIAPDFYGIMEVIL